MPTNEEFSVVRVGQPQEQSYKQNEQESRSGGAYGQVSERHEPQPTTGQYPNTFDKPMGAEPLGLDMQSDENPFYYPTKVFDPIKCTGPGQSYVQNEQESVSGEYGSCRAQPTGPYPGTDMVPSPDPSPQFKSKMSGEPGTLLESTRKDVMMHSDMNQYYGLNQPVSTLGSHAWLRDGLATYGEEEPGNAVPTPGMKLPKRG